MSNLNKTAEELEQRIRPNTFVTLTLRQGIQNGVGSFIAGSPQAYQRVMLGLFKSVNRRLYGKRRWRRKKPPLFNLTVLERSPAGSWHIHACVKRPDHVTIEEFRQVIDDCWKSSEWYLPIWQVDDYRGGGVSYILKDGQEGILVGPSYF